MQYYNKDDWPTVFFYSEDTLNNLEIKNSLFENINVSGPYPLLKSKRLLLK